jgi:hypothetical protein
LTVDRGPRPRVGGASRFFAAVVDRATPKV